MLCYRVTSTNVLEFVVFVSQKRSKNLLKKELSFVIQTTTLLPKEKFFSKDSQYHILQEGSSFSFLRKARVVKQY